MHFFLQIRALFSYFWKRAGETSPPPTSSYAPGIGFRETEKYQIKAIDDDIYDRKIEFKAKKWNNKNEQELQ